MYDNFLIYLLTEDRKKDALEKLRQSINLGKERIEIISKIFNDFNSQEIPRPTLGGKKFSDKYPVFVLNIIKTLSFETSNQEEVLRELNSFMEEMALLYSSFTPAEKDHLPKISGHYELTTFLQNIKFRKDKEGQKLFLKKLEDAKEYIASRQAKIVYKDDKNNILVLRAYTYDASVALGNQAWCVSSTNTDKYFYQYQLPEKEDTKIFFLYFFNANERTQIFSRTAIQHSDDDVVFWDVNDRSHNEEEFKEEITSKIAYGVSDKQLQEILSIVEREYVRDPGIAKKFDEEQYHDELTDALSGVLYDRKLRDVVSRSADVSRNLVSISLETVIKFPGKKRKFYAWVDYATRVRDSREGVRSVSYSRVLKNTAEESKKDEGVFRYFISSVYGETIKKEIIDSLKSISEYYDDTKKYLKITIYNYLHDDETTYVEYTFEYTPKDTYNDEIHRYEEVFDLLSDAYSNDQLQKEIFKRAGLDYQEISNKENKSGSKQIPLSFPASTISENKKIKLVIKI